MSRPLQIGIVVAIFFVGASALLYMNQRSSQALQAQQSERCLDRERRFRQAMKDGSQAMREFYRAVVKDCLDDGYRLTLIDAADLSDDKS